MSYHNGNEHKGAAAIPEPTATVKVSAKDDLDVWAVGEGMPVVLIHGLFFYNLLKPLAEELAKKGDYQVIWYHRRGYYEKPTEPVDIPEQAHDVVKILDELKIPEAHIVGHSAGAVFTLALVTEAAGRVSSVSLLDFMLANDVESGGMIKEFTRDTIAKAMDGDPEGAAKDWLDMIGITRDVMERVLPGSWSAMLKDSPTLFKVDLPALDKWSPDPARVKAIEVPVAHLAISDAPPFRETVELLHSWLPKLTVLELSTDDHFFPVTATDETAGVLDNWFKGQDTQ
jgi:pimeloyl-ACP methyl ester carboxylesterase